MRLRLTTVQSFEVQHIGQQSLEVVSRKLHVRQLRQALLFILLTSHHEFNQSQNGIQRSSNFMTHHR